VKKPLRFWLGTLTVFLLALMPSVVPVGNLNLPASAASVSEAGDAPSCTQTVGSAIGVTVSKTGSGDCVLSFSSDNSWTPEGVGEIDVLIVGGGGGGGSRAWGGGGGAGGVQYGAGVSVSDFASTVAIAVGAGGLGGPDSGSGKGSTGGDSSFGSVTARGGGGGGGYGWNTEPDANAEGADGGSGGGSGEAENAIVGGSVLSTPYTGFTHYGNAGGRMSLTSGSQAGSGGGGAGGVGGEVTVYRQPGDGGRGQPFSITGSSVTYAGGGGGATTSVGSVCSDGGAGGGGSGGCGGAGSSGTDGLGGGGGASHIGTGGQGGSGIVIVKYSLTPDNPTSVSVSSIDGGARLTYTNPTHWGGGTLSLQYRVDGGSWTELGETDGSTDISLANGAVYSIEMRAANSLGYFSSGTSALSVLPSPSGEILRLDGTNSSSYSGSGATWSDISGESNDATISGATWDSRAKSFSFDGSNDAAAIGNFAYDFSRGIAIHAVVDFGDSSGSMERILDFGQGADDDNIWFGREGTTDVLAFESLTGSTKSRCSSNSGTIVPGVHTYSVVVSTSGSCQFYRDGDARGSATTGQSLPTAVVRTSNLIGDSNWTADAYFEGSIQSIVLYNTAQEIPICKPIETSVTGDGTVGESSVPYTALSFTTAGECEWTAPAGVASVSYLAVGGGGGGGGHIAGGGGGGEVLSGTKTDVSSSSPYTVSVGVGGLGGLRLYDTAADNVSTSLGHGSAGADTSIFGVSATGGSGGRTLTSSHLGGSGGSSGNGNSGGAGSSGSPNCVKALGGGGAGSTAVGIAANSSTQSGGAGGAGTLGNIINASTYFGGGGGGGVNGGGSATQCASSGTVGAGGAGGGGSAGAKTSSTVNLDTAGEKGLANTGGGGGGATGNSTNSSLERSGGNGGSGIVIIRFSLAPGAPGSVSVTAGSAEVALSWTASTHTGGNAVSDYVVEYQEDGAGSWSTFADGTSTSTSATVTGLTNGTTYNFRVMATNSAGTGEVSSSVSAIPVSANDSYLTFDGSNDYAFKSGSLSLNKDRFSVEAWVYDEATSNGEHGVLRVGTTDRIFIQVVKGSGSNEVTIGMNGTSSHISTGFELPQNEWVHLAVTRAGTTWKLYANGQLYKSGTTGATATIDSGGLWIGRSSNTSSNYWKGRIDQVKIWDYTLSDSEVVTSMHAWSDIGVTGGASAPDLVALYDFNSQSASTLSDEEGSFDLTISGSVTTSDYDDVKIEETTGGNKILRFPRSYLTSGGGWKVPSVATEVRYLVVAGGGGGGYDEGGGGGAGGLRQATGYSDGVTAGNYLKVTVGQGGLGSPGNDESSSAGSTSNPATLAASGQNSVFATITSTGGGGGGDAVNQTNAIERLGLSGGSGGGAAGENYGRVTTGGAASPSGQGNAGGKTDSSSWRGGAGGGGAGSAGSNGASNAGGAGGAGIAASWTGLSTIFAAGGGGGAGNTSKSGGAAGSLGAGAGANNSTEPGRATANTGSGGGGGGGASVGDRYGGGDGASGIVVLRYELLAEPTISSAPSNQTVVSGNNASFSVTASDATSYQWQVSTDSGSSWADVSGATASTLTLTSVATSSNLYQYRVVITNTSGLESASVTSSAGILTVEDGATVTGAICDGSYTKNGLTLEAGHGTVFYIDTGQGQEIDAGYIAYVVESTTARSDLWVEVSDFTGGVVSLADASMSAQPLGSITAGGTDTAYFMIKATGATSTAQSHIVKVYDKKPTIGSPQPLYSCGFSFVEVAETIKAAANKVEAITSTSASRVGSTMTITVQGDTGTIGQGNDIDGRMIWVTPAARSDWPTSALRLEATSITFYSDRNRRNVLTSHTDTLRVNASTTPALSGTNRQYYTATYTFRVIGSAASAAPIIPIAMISSGTQVKHTDVGSLPTGGSATVDVTSPTIDLTVTKSVSATTTINSNGTTTLSYDITLTNGGSDSLVIDEVVDTPDSDLTLVSGTAEFNGSSIADPGATGASSLAFSGPFTVPANSARVFEYDMTFVTCSVGTGYSFDNVATAKSGSVIIGSGSATQSNVNIAGNCGTQQAVVTVTDTPVDPVVVTGAANSVTSTTATLTGTVDPNSQPNLGVRIRYSTNSNLSSATTVNLADTTFASSPYGVSTDLTSLSAATTYYYVVEVEDPDGGWISGTTRSFLTDPAAATVSATTTAASSITTTSAVLNGSVDANAVSGGAKVKFEWATDTTTGGGSACSSRGASTVTGFLQSEDGSGGTEDALLTGFSAVPMSYELSGLSANTDYCYQILAFDGSGYTSQTTGGWVGFTSTAKTAQTISWSTSANPLPAGGTTTVAATATSGLSVTYSSADTNVCTVDSSTGAVTAVASSGTCSITASQSGDGIYYAAIPVTTSFAIIPPVVSPATLTAGTYQTSGYSQTLLATGGNGTYSSWTVSSGSLPSGLSLASGTGIISGTPTSAGVYTFSVTVTSNGVTSAAQSFSITVAKRTVTVSAGSPSVVFGSAAPAISPAYSGFVGSDVTTVGTGDNVAPTCTSTYVVGQNAGTNATSSCSGGFNDNYVFSYVTGTVTVTKFPVTITAIDAAKQNVVDGSNTTVAADPALRWTSTSPLPAGETIADVVPAGVSISRAGSGTTPGVIATASLPAGEQDGTFTITPSGVAGSNYTVTFVTGTLTIQEPLQVPSLSVSDKTMTFGDSETASTFIGGSATNRSSGSVAGTFVYTYLDSSGDPITLTDLSGLDAGTYLVRVAFTADDDVDANGVSDGVYYVANPVIETMTLTVQRKAVTVTAADKKKLVGALDPELTWSATGFVGSDTTSNLAPVTISRSSGETEGSYVITSTGGDSVNYTVTHVPGTFYIYEPVITVTESRGVLTSRTVRADCKGLKPGSSANFVLTTGGSDSTIATTTVASDGTCPMSSTLSSSIPQGVHTLKITGTDPLDGAVTKTRNIILLSASIQVITNNSGSGGGGGGGTSPGGAPPLIQAPLSIVTGQPGIRRPVVPPGLANQPGTAQSPATPESPASNPGQRLVPALPGTANSSVPGLPGGGNRTLDLGTGVIAADEAPSSNGANGVGTSGQGVRSVQELAAEDLGGFAPGVSTRIEILGARTGARFVVTEAEQIDTFTVIRAIQNSIPAQSADFFALDDVRPAVAPPVPPAWEDNERAGIAEFFAASGLPEPVSLADLDTTGFSQWIQVTGSADTYLPGSLVYLTLTSEPLVLASGQVARDGTVVITGSLPVEWLTAGEHRVRLVGIRALDGVSVDDQGEVQLSDELMAEIQRFDLGTQSTIAVMGPNLTGGDHVALRVVPLVPEAPWWTLWFILLGFLLMVLARWRGWARTVGRRLTGVLLVLASATPGVVLGWLSTVTSVVWWALGLGLLASLLSWFAPESKKVRRVKD